MSKPIELLDLVWFNVTRPPWERLNNSMRAALELAIGSGLEFDIDDIGIILSNYDSGRWAGDCEWIYSFAIGCRNTSAALSFEKWKGREPIFGDNVRFPIMFPSMPRFVHRWECRRKRERLFVGAAFLYAGRSIRVTSFGDKGVIACSYTRTKDDRTKDGREKLAKRYLITQADILAARKEGKRP